MKNLFLALSVALSGCASLEPQTVKIPIAVSCNTENPITPSYRYSPPYDTIFEAVRDLLGDKQLSVAYEIELSAALKSCK